jgi:hypothetical protein
MEIVLVIWFSILLVAVFFWLDWRSTRLAEQYREAIKRHPAGGRCLCGAEVDDWQAHQRLAHAAREQGVEDTW